MSAPPTPRKHKPVGYWRGILIALDHVLNAVTFGHAGETLSSRLARERKHGERVGAAGCVVLDVIDPGHCSGALEETPEGEIDPHHAGVVIYELPPDHPRLRKVQP